MNVHISERVDTVIWDFDGTILDSFKIFSGVLGTVLQNRGMEVPPEHTFATHFNGPLESSIRGVVGSSITSHDFNGILHDFLELDNDYIQNADDHLHQDAVNLARRIRAAGGRTQLVVTDREHGVDRRNGSPRNIINKSCLREIMDRVICRDDHGYRKPDVRVLGARRNQIQEAVVIGDQMVDVELAQILGGTALLVRRNELPIGRMDQLMRFKDRTHVVSSLDEVGVKYKTLPIPRRRSPIHEQAGYMDTTAL